MTGTHVYDAAGFLIEPRRGHVHLQRPRRAQDGHGRRPDGRLRVRRVAAAGRAHARAACARSSCTATPAQPVPRHREPRRRRAHAVLLRPRRPAVRAASAAAARYYVGTDQVGTPRVVTDAAGAVVKTFSTNAFGVRNKARRDRHVRARARLRRRHRGPGHRARALRPARLRAGHGPLHRARPDPARGRHEPVRCTPATTRSPSATRPAWTRAAAPPVTSSRRRRRREQHRRQVQRARRVGQERLRPRGDRDRRRPARSRTTRSSMPRGKLDDGLDKIDTAVEVVEDAFEIYEAEQSSLSLPEQGVAWLKCGLRCPTTRRCRSTSRRPRSSRRPSTRGFDHARRVRDEGTPVRPNRQPEALPRDGDLRRCCDGSH